MDQLVNTDQWFCSKMKFKLKLYLFTESIEIPEAELKEDGSNSIQSQNAVFKMFPPTEFDHSQLQVTPEDKNRHQMNFLPL